MILVYHNIGEGETAGYVRLETFERQMSAIVSQGIQVVRLEDYNPLDSNQYVITFDDGLRNIEQAFPVLQKYGFPFYVFVVGDLIGKADEFFAESDFDRIRAAGGILGWHTQTHPDDLTSLSSRRIKKELTNPYGWDVLAYPCGKNDERVANIARKLGYKFARSGNGQAKRRLGNLSLDSQIVFEYTDVRFLNDLIVRHLDIAYMAYPCNLRCHYCYVGQHATEEERRRIMPTKYDVTALEKALNRKRMGGTCIVTYCATGETLLLPQSIEYIKAILRAGHFVHISTNLTISKHIEELIALPQEMRERIFFKASFQYLELKRKNMLDRYAENCHKIWDAGMSCSPELIPNDELIPYIPEVKSWSLEHLGALPHLNIPRDELAAGIKLLSKYPIVEFARIWESFYSELFRFKTELWEKPISNFCYAGKFSLFVMLNTGDMYSCHSGSRIGNFFEGDSLKTRAVVACPHQHCYISHAWLGFGACPAVRGTTYLLERDRVMSDGRHWVSERCRHAFRQRVCDNNELYKPAAERHYRWAERLNAWRKGRRRKLIRCALCLIPIAQYRRNLRKRLLS